MARFSFVVLVLAFGVSSAFALSNYAGHHGSHDRPARAYVSGNLTERMSTSQRDWKLGKRFDGARCTNYVTGLGACGATNSASDYVVALNTPQYGNGEHCFETITITANGKSVQAQIVDRCVECPFGALDLTSSLFSYFAPLSDGVFYASWTFGSGESEKTSTPTPTSTHKETTSSTWTPETTSWSSTSTWSSSTTTWSSSSSTSTSSTSSTTSTSATATATSGVDMNSALDVLNYGLIQLGGLISGAAQVNLETSE